MHQHPRVPPSMASPARSPQTNPTRSNNSREYPTHLRHDSETFTPSDQGIGMAEGLQGNNQAQNTSPEGKLDLIVQNYFYKAALMILDARTNLTQAFTTKENKPRVNRWFNTELPETDDILESTRRWKYASVQRERVPSMIIETYIDLRDLTGNQKLVITDENGKRHDVETALRERLAGQAASSEQLRKMNILLERWTCELGHPWPELDKGDFPLNEVLPKVYKGSIVLYRSLFAHLKFMPAWKFYRRSIKPHPGLVVPRLRWRIYEGPQRSGSAIDELELHLANSNERATETIRWDPVDSPAGQFSIKVAYRINCDLRVETSESVFSSQFIASDEQWFQPSLPRSSLLNPTQIIAKPRPLEMGSVPHGVKEIPVRQRLNEIAEQGPAYGSMSTFHNAGASRIGTSPLSALRAARDLHAQSPTDSSSPTLAETRQPQTSDIQNRKSCDATTSTPRRVSVSIQPFKTPAFSSSVPIEQAPPSSPRIGSVNRNSPLAALTEARNPSNSSQAAMSPKTSPKLGEVLPVSSAASSPRPTPSRFSSSFSHRRNRPSVGAISIKAEDENGSSGRGSASSSNVQSGVTIDAGGPSSLQTDDDSISEFLRMLDARKELKSFKPQSSSGTGASTARGTAAALNKFHQLRDSHAALSDSLTASEMLQRSNVSSSSRQLANVPPMVAGTSTSLSSSPGERMSPRTPHTPAIPSRLSSNSIIEYNQNERGPRPRPHRFSGGEEGHAMAARSLDGRQATATVQDNPHNAIGAIPIPTSLRNYQPAFRRSSSAAARHQNEDRGSSNDRYDVTDDIGNILPFALRSASMGDGDEREPLSLSGMVRLQEAVMPIPTGVAPPPDLEDRNLVDMETLETRTQSLSAAGQITHNAMRPISENNSSGRHVTAEAASSSIRSSARHNFSRPANLTNFEDDEPLLFAMSEQLEGSTPTTAGGVGNSGGTTGGIAGSRGGRMQRWQM